MSILGAAAIAGGANLLGGVLGLAGQNSTNRQQLELNRQQQLYNTQQNNLAYQRSVEQWKRENEYNSPAAQMGRFAAAGLNPNLIYGQMSEGSSLGTFSGASSPSAPTLRNPMQNIGESLSNSISQFMQLRNLTLEQRKAESEIEAQNIQNNLVKFRAMREEQEYNFNKVTENVRAAMLSSGLDLDKQRLALGALDQAYRNEQIKNLRWNNTFLADTYNDRLALSGLDVQLKAADIAAKQAARRSSDASTARSLYDLEFRKSMEKYFKAQIRFDTLRSQDSAYISRKTRDYRVWQDYVGMKNDIADYNRKAAFTPLELKSMNYQVQQAYNDLVMSNINREYIEDVRSDALYKFSNWLFGNPYQDGGRGTSTILGLLGIGALRGRSMRTPRAAYSSPTTTHKRFGYDGYYSSY